MVALITSDQWRTRKKEVFHGVFENSTIAIETAKAKNLYNYQTTVIVKEIEINEFLN